MITYSKELDDLSDERDQICRDLNFNQRYSSGASYNVYIRQRMDMIEDRIDGIERLRKTDHNRDYYIVMERQFREESKKAKEMQVNISARTSILKKLFDEDISLSHLPYLPFELWNIIAEYEGGLESSVLGGNVTSTSSWSWCSIL